MSRAWPAPAVGDIVWCRFPELPDLQPGPKPRPALVIGIETRSDGVNVRVAYGTSQRVDQLLAGEFSITRNFHPQAFLLAGLAEDTKFNFGEVIELPWRDRYFGVPPRPKHGQTPKLGTLHASVYQAAGARIMVTVVAGARPIVDIERGSYDAVNGQTTISAADQTEDPR